MDSEVGCFANTTYEYYYYYEEYCPRETVIQFESTVVPAFLTVVVLLSLVGNGLVLLILVLYENLKSLTNIFLLNLAVSNLIFTLGLPFWVCYHIWGWTFGDFMCKGVNFVFSAGFYSSTVFLILMSVQSYVAVVHPLSDWNRWQWFALFLIFAWFFSFAAALPAALFSEVMSGPTDSNKLYCVYSIAAISSVEYGQKILFVVAFLVLGFCCIGILKNILSSPTNIRNRNMILTFCIVVVFFVSQVPYNIVMFLQSLTYYQIEPFTECDVSIRLDYASHICRLLAYSHCCLNPVLYVVVDVKFRNHLWTLLQKVSRC